MPSGSRRRSNKPKKPREAPEKKWYNIRSILQERQRGGRIEYLIDWDDDKHTGEQYPATWHPSEDVTAKAIFDWKKNQGEFATSDEDSASEIAPSQAPAVDTLDSSQPIQPPHRRKRQRENTSGAYSDSEIEDSDEDALSPPKRHRSEPLSLSSSSEVDTDAASDILPKSPSNIFVAIASKIEFDATEYLSVSNSQGSTSFGSQPLSALEDEDNQVILAENFSQRTIPDSQEYSAFDSQDSHFTSTDLPITHQGVISSGREILDSQRQSSLGTSQSKTTGSQAHLSIESDHLSHPVTQQSPLQPERSQEPQHRQEDPDYSEPVFLTQYFPSESQHRVIPNTSPIIPELRIPTCSEADLPARPRSSSQDSASLAAQAAAQLAQEQDSVPASFSDTSIPSHQVDNLPGQDSAGHSSNTSAHNLPESHFGTPVFVTQLAFDFDVPSSSEATHSQKDKSEGSSSETNQEAAQTAIVATQYEDLVTIRDSQNDSNNTQHAQRLLPLPHISASQIDTNSLTEEEIVPDTVRRRPLKRRLSFTSTASTSNASRRGASTTSSGCPLPASQSHRRENSLEESFRTCVERPSLPPTDPTAVALQATRLSSLPPKMASTDGEPMSAIEELMRLSQSIMGDDADEEPYSGSGGNQQQVDGDGGPGTETIDAHDFSMPIENPLMEIHSQLPISTDWNMEGDSTSSELPVQPSAPIEPVIEAPVSQPPQTANMGDIFPGGLMPPEPVQQLPMTISPSDISRSMEPDDGLNPLHQQEDLPLNILSAEDNATAKSTASSPDVEEQYPSGPPTAMDQSEYLVTVSFPANIRSVYTGTMSEYKKEIEKFTLMCRNGEELPDQSLVDSIGRLLDQLRDICDLPASLDGASIDALSAEDLRKHAMGTNSKYFFVGRFLERLQTSNKKVLIIVRDINIMGYLEAVIGTNEMAYSLKGLHELDSQDEHSLHIVLMHTEQTLVDDLSDFDVVIGFDGGILRTDVVTQWAQMNGRKPMLIRLMTTYSIEHLELFMPDDKEELERKNALLISLYQSRALISSDDQAEMIDGLTAHFANQVIDPEPKFGWEPEPIPNSVLDLYSESQMDSQMPPTAEELKSRKRKANDDPQEVTKRLRVSPPPGQAGGSVDEAVRGHVNPKPSRVHVRTTQDHLDSLNNKIFELEHQLGEKTTLEHNLRKHITNISKRVKSHDKTTNHIHERLMEAIEDRSRFEAQQREAKLSEEKALKKCQTWQNKVQKLEDELEKKSATLEKALVDAGTVAADVFKQKTDELEQSHAKIAELEKKLESRDNELSYARDVYQTANQANSELSRENKVLKEQVAEFHKQAAGSLAQIQNTNANEQVKEMRRQIEETQAITRDREKELTRIEKELRTLKNGRRETRQQSVPRSPRLGMMSPRAPRAAGGSASRGTSPVPYDSSGSTPVPGMQFLPSNNHRFNHLRE